MIFAYCTDLVGTQQILQIVNLTLQLAALVGLADLYAGFHSFKDLRTGNDILVLLNRLFPAGEGIVGHDAHTA